MREVSPSSFSPGLSISGPSAPRAAAERRLSRSSHSPSPVRVAASHPTLCLLNPAWPHQPFAGRPLLQEAGKARTQGSWLSNPNPSWDCLQTDLAMSLASRELPGRNTTTSNCKTQREEAERKQLSFADDLKQNLVGVSLLSVPSENPGSQR